MFSYTSCYKRFHKNPLIKWLCAFINTFNRHDFYQHPEEVVVSILAKGKGEEDVAIEFGEQIVCFMFLYMFVAGIIIMANSLQFQINYRAFFCLQLSVDINEPGEDAYRFQSRLFAKVPTFHFPISFWNLTYRGIKVDFKTFYTYFTFLVKWYT